MQPLSITVLFPMAAHAVAAAIFVWPLATPGIAAISAVGGALGALAGTMLFRRASRPWVVPLWFILGLTLVAVGRWLGPPLSSDPQVQLWIKDAWSFSVVITTLVSVARFLTLRFRPMVVLESSFVVWSFAQLTIAHRHGAIHRPYAVADPMIARGWDPSVLLYAVGGLCVIALLLLWVRERNPLRLLVQLFLSAALLTTVFLGFGLLQTPAPPDDPSGLGLRGGKGQNGSPNEDDGLEFKEDYNSEQNMVPMAVVVLHDDYEPPSGFYYFRQSAFSHYNGQRLVRSTRHDVDRDLATRYPHPRVQIPEPPRSETPDGELLRSPVATTVGLLADHNRPLGLEAPVSLKAQPNPNPGRFKGVYRVRSHAPLFTVDAISDVSLPPRWAETLNVQERAHYTRPPEDARYAELARNIVEGAALEGEANEIKRALAVRDWLSKHGVYSLKTRHTARNSTDPTASFLFGDRTGYCVHFAHAAVYLMRTLGVPSRVATGYAIENAARRGGSALLLTGAMAHAWPEIHVAGLGWMVADVSPGATLSAPPPPPDADLQRLLGELLRGLKPLPRPVDPIDETLRRATRWGTFAAQGLLTLALLAVSFLWLVKAWRALVPFVAPGERRWKLHYRAHLDRLSALGVRRRFAEGRHQFAARLGFPHFEHLTRVTLDQHFGEGARTPPHHAASREARLARRELRATTAWYRRLWAWLVPWNWITVR